MEHKDSKSIDMQILDILIRQKYITDQGEYYSGEKDWALNQIKSLLTKQKEEIAEKIQRMSIPIEIKSDLIEELKKDSSTGSKDNE